MKKTLWAFALVLGTGCLFPALSPASGPNGSISLDGQLSRRVSGEIGHNYGMGGFLSLEFQPVQAFSIGVGADLMDFVGIETPGQSFLESLNVVGRGIFNGGSAWQPYLMAGYGLNPKIDLQGDYTWWGDYHIMGGMGALYFFDPQCALDMAVVYNYFEAGADPLHTVNVRLGFSYFFVPALNKYSVTGEPVPASRRVSPASTQPAAQAPLASAPKAVASAPATQTAAGALAALKAAQKSNAASTGVPQGSAIGPRGMASYREPAPTSRPQAEKQALGVPISKKEMGAPTSRPQAEKQALGVPISKKEMGAPAPSSKAAQKKAEEELAEMEEELGEEPIETPVPKSGKTSLGKLAFREPAAKAKPDESKDKSKKTQAAEVLVRKGDSLWDTAARTDVYGDPELYPLLVDANKGDLKPRQFILEPGLKLAVPRDVPEESIQKARKDAWTAKYQSYSGRRLSPEGYKKWREKNIPTSASGAETKTPASRPQAEKHGVGVPISKKEMGAPASRPQAEKQGVGVTISKKEMGAPASRPQAEKSGVGVPISKKEMGAPASKLQAGSKPVESAKKGKQAATATPVPKTKAPAEEEEETTEEEEEASPEGPTEILTLKNHSLWNTAGRKDVYGDPELYPLLLDANRKLLKADQMALKAGTRLTVPRGVSEDKIRKARVNAWTNDYMRYRGIGMTQPAYQKWRKSKAK